MKKDWEKYRDTGIMGAYSPEDAHLQRCDDGVRPFYRDTAYWQRENHMEAERMMLVGGAGFRITSVFPCDGNTTPTDKLFSLIDAELEKESHNR